jgi:tetratricopeptide (TPR) repeat protein
MSHESIDDQYARWQRNPDAVETAALCEALRANRRPDLVEIVGSHAARQTDVRALLAAARMYTDAGRLDDAQSVLVAAGRLAPREGEVYRWLGEVLLRRGDAERAEKVLEKAVQFGADRAATSLYERAKALVPTQRASGPAAVAEAVARSAPAVSPPTPIPNLAGPRDESELTRRIVPAESDEDVETQIRKGDDVKAVLDAAGRAPPVPAAGRPAPPKPPPPVLGPPAMGLPPPSNPPPPLPAPAIGVKPFDDIVFTTPTRGLGFDIQPNGAGSTAQTSDNRISPDDLISDAGPLPTAGVSAATASFGSAPSSQGARKPPEPPVNPFLLDALARPPAQVGGAPIPEARDVLDALQVAGIYEPDGATTPTTAATFVWAKPEGVRRIFSLVTLIGLAVVLIGGGAGTYYYVTDKRAKDHVKAEELLVKVDKDLHTSEPALLEPSEKSIASAFDLESRSSHAAITWLHERILVGLLRGGADIAFEDATTRAKSVGVEEKKLAFAYVASFLFQGDTAGAAATVAKWDSAAHDDAWFQLLAGATFERAGDPRALERYSASVKLDPELIVTQWLLTRATALDGDARRAGELSREFRVRYPARAEGSALVALAWTRDPARGDEPPEIKEVTEKGDALPIGLRSVPHAARAILALHKGAVDEARPALQKGLEVADTPGMAAWLGSIALVMGDENLARKAALSAVSFSAVYPPARVLAARVALLGARLDEALKAAEDLSPSSADVAIVTAAVSYERLDGERLTRSFDAVNDESKKSPYAIPLLRGKELLAGNIGVLNGEKARDMSDDEAPWADLVAMDWALDAGDIDSAKKIADRWRGEPRSMRAIRLARLARYEGHLEDAEKLSRVALETGTVTMRALSERVFTLVAMKRDNDALALFKTYPNVGGPLAKWLRAYATAAHGKIDEARAIVSQEDPPPTAAAMPARIIAAMAYAAMKDARHGNEYTKPIAQAGFANPDVAWAAEKVGAGKVVRRAK